MLGAHTSIAGGLHRAILRGKDLGCDAIQIFTGSRNRWEKRKLSAQEIDAFHKAREATSVRPVAAHNSYLINLASPVPAMFEKSLAALVEELERAELLGIPFLVMHPGAHMGAGERPGIRRIVEGINRANDKTARFRVKILLETTSGQGTSLGYRFEHLTRIIEGVEDPERLGVCFDTCHAFAAGYDFRTRGACEQLLTAFDRVVGCDRLRLFHVNDSKQGLASKRDRHEHLGHGLIGLKGFSYLLKDPMFSDLPFLLETPKGKDERGVDKDIINLRVLRDLMKAEDNP